MKTLLSAYSCLPSHGSEPGVGWNWAQCIAANGHDVTVITREANRPGIENHLVRVPATPMQFIYHDLRRVGEVLYKLPFGNYLYYLIWQYTAAKLAFSLHLAEPFDRVQHVTWSSFRVPSFMGRLGIPFTFGPVGGGEDTPRKLRRGLGWRGSISDALRRFSSATAGLWMRFTYESATEIIATTPETLLAIPSKYRHKARCRQAVGIDPGVARRPDTCAALQQNRAKLELLFAGRLLPWKGLHLVLKALAHLGASQSTIHLTIIGAGSDASRLRQMCRRLRLDGMVSWVPWMSRDALQAIYPQFDLFIFPSLHDSGGMAVLEAMTFGLPVLCLDLGGPGMTVDDQCGHVIPARNLDEERVVDEIKRFFNRILHDPNSLVALSESARTRASTLTWQANVDSVYPKALTSQAS